MNTDADPLPLPPRPESAGCAASPGVPPAAPPASRRAFGLGMFSFGAAAVASCGASPATGAPPVAPAAATEEAAQEGTPPATPAEAVVPILTDATEVELILEWIRRSDPERLKPEHLAALRREVQSNLARAALLHRFPLENGDFPMPLPRFGKKPPPAG